MNFCLQRSRDSGGESDTTIKQQLSSLNYVIKLIDNRLAKLQDYENSGHMNPFDESKLFVNWKPLNLPIDAILKSNVALSYFIDYVTNIGEQSYLFFYLNVEGKSDLHNMLLVTSFEYIIYFLLGFINICTKLIFNSHA